MRARHGRAQICAARSAALRAVGGDPQDAAGEGRQIQLALQIPAERSDPAEATRAAELARVLDHIGRRSPRQSSDSTDKPSDHTRDAEKSAKK